VVSGVLTALVAAAVVALLVSAGLAVLYAVTVVPFLVAVDLAERRGCSTGRWAGLSLAAVLLALGLAAGALLGGAPRPLLVPALAVGFVPAVVLARRSDTVGGRAGRHESPV
jgi:hypothetical protein